MFYIWWRKSRGHSVEICKCRRLTTFTCHIVINSWSLHLSCSGEDSETWPCIRVTQNSLVVRCECAWQVAFVILLLLKSNKLCSSSIQGYLNFHYHLKSLISLLSSAPFIKSYKVGVGIFLIQTPGNEMSKNEERCGSPSAWDTFLLCRSSQWPPGLCSVHGKFILITIKTVSKFWTGARQWHFYIRFQDGLALTGKEFWQKLLLSGGEGELTWMCCISLHIELSCPSDLLAPFLAMSSNRSDV